MSPSDFVSRGRELVAQGQYQEAVKVCRLGLLGKPATVDGRIVLGQALLALGRADEALAEMRVALELDPSSAAAHAVAEQARQAAAAPGRSVAADFSAGDSHTKHYPNHVDDEPDGADGDDDDGGTRQILAKAPPSRPSRPALPRADGAGDNTPPPSLLSVGDRSITVEVDPESEGVEVDDFGDVAAPPIAGRGPDLEAQRAAIMAARREAARGKAKQEVTVVLDDDELMDADTPAPAPSGMVPRRALPQNGAAPGGARSMVRRAVAIEAGPLEDSPTQAVAPLRDLDAGDDRTEANPPIDEPTQARPPVSVPLPAPPPTPIIPMMPMMPSASANRETLAHDSVSPSQLAQMLAQQPHIMQVTTLPPPRPPVVVPVVPPNPRSQIAAALPTAAAIPIPVIQTVPTASSNMPTPIAGTLRAPLTPQQQASADALDALLGPPEPAPPAPSAQPWAQRTVLAGSPAQLSAQLHPPKRRAHAEVGIAGADEPTRQAQPVDPRIAAAIRGDASVLAGEPRADLHPRAVALKTGVRTRSGGKLSVLVWMLVGAVVIGGGVFAGFQIRAMRLRKQIAAARTRATDTAKADTWQGWIAARDSLADIVRAADTPDNRAALARANGLLAYEFGDADARTDAAKATDRTRDGLDNSIAAAYVGLATSDPKLARAAAERAIQLAPQDPAALYVLGQAELASGDLAAALEAARSASDKDARALYFLGLARVHAAMLSWDDAIADTTRALAASPELPSAVTAEATDIIAAGELAKHVGGPSDLRSAVERVIAEAGKPVADQAHGVTPQELAFAHLALARIEYARNEPTRARAEVKAAADLKIEDQRVAEDEIETLVEIGDYAHAHEAVDSALAVWPTSRRVRIASAQMAVAEGKPDLAIKILDATGTALPPLGQAVRGIARQATGDPAGARADLDAALQKLPNLEPALVGRAWLSLEAGAVDDAKKLIEPHYDLATASVPLATVYAAILRETNDASNRDKAKNVLLNVVSRPPSFDVARAQLELGRVLRDLGELPGARDAYAKAAQFAGASELGNQARLEAADLAIDSGDISGGAESFQNIQLAGPILVDAARARTLAGDPAGARKLLDQADATPGVPKWRIRRERARIAMRRDQPGVAIDYLTKALDESGEDVETMLLAADAAGAIDPVKDETHREFAGRVQTLIPEKLPDRPEALLVTGKLAFAAGKEADAQAAFAKALARLEAQHGSARRLAQATFGLAVVAYNQKADADAHRQFELVTHQDPSIYAAYLYMADLEAAKQPKHALELLQTAVTFAPESPSAWGFLGRQAQALNNQKVLADAIAKLTALDPNNRDLKDLVKPKKK